MGRHNCAPLCALAGLWIHHLHTHHYMALLLKIFCQGPRPKEGHALSHKCTLRLCVFLLHMYLVEGYRIPPRTVLSSLTYFLALQEGSVTIHEYNGRPKQVFNPPGPLFVVLPLIAQVIKA